MYVLGKGVSKDYILAHMWFSLAGSKGNENALKSMQILEKEMTLSQIEKARETAKNWGQISINSIQ
jgi:uncharacterized protein